MMRPYYIRRLACLCILCLLLCGCGTDIFEKNTKTSVSELPSLSGNTIMVGTGDSSAAYSDRMTLYYRSSDGRLVPEYRLMHVYPGNEPAALVAAALSVDPFFSADMTSAIPDGVTVNGCRTVNGIATCDLSAGAAALNDEDKYIMYAAICNTLLSLPGIQCAEVLCEGRALEIAGLPAGAETKLTEDAAAGYLQRMSEGILARDGGSVERNAVIYVPTGPEGKCVPRCIKLDISSGDALTAAAEAVVSAIDGAELLECISSVDESGMRTANVRLACEDGTAQIENAMALTLCTFVPNTDCAETEINGMMSEKLTYAGLRHDICSTMILYTPTENGKLSRSECVFDGLAPSARDVIDAMIERNVFPEEASDADIKGIHKEGGILYINMSSHLYSLCVNLDAKSERLLVYSVVNSLCTNDAELYAVKLLVEDENVDVLSQNICLLTPLMPDPGLIEE